MYPNLRVGVSLLLARKMAWVWFWRFRCWVRSSEGNYQVSFRGTTLTNPLHIPSSQSGVPAVCFRFALSISGFTTSGTREAFSRSLPILNNLLPCLLQFGNQAWQLCQSVPCLCSTSRVWFGIFGACKCKEEGKAATQQLVGVLPHGRLLALKSRDVSWDRTAGP